MQQLKHGILIPIEGIDGSGKSTLAHNLAAALENHGLPILLTKEPGGSQLGKQLRTILQTQTMPVSSQAEYLLFAADRAQHFNEVIIPALAQKKIIISDRMCDSSLVYQGYGRGLDLDMIKKINSWVMQNIRSDVTVYVRVSLDIALKRIKKRNEKLTAFEKEHTSFLQKLIQGFETIYKDRKDVILIDGNQEPDKVKNDALQAIFSWIKTKQLLK